MVNVIVACVGTAASSSLCYLQMYLPIQFLRIRSGKADPHLSIERVMLHQDQRKALQKRVLQPPPRAFCAAATRHPPLATHRS